MPVLGFFENGWTIAQPATGLSAALAQPMEMTPTIQKRVDTYVFRDKSTAGVDAGKSADRLTITGMDMPNASQGVFPYLFPFTFSGGALENQMAVLDAMTDAGKRVYISNLALIDNLDTGYQGYYLITSLDYTRKPGPRGVAWYELVLDAES